MYLRDRTTMKKKTSTRSLQNETTVRLSTDKTKNICHTPHPSLLNPLRTPTENETHTYPAPHIKLYQYLLQRPPLLPAPYPPFFPLLVAGLGFVVRDPVARLVVYAGYLAQTIIGKTTTTIARPVRATVFIASCKQGGDGQAGDQKKTRGPFCSRVLLVWLSKRLQKKMAYA